MVPPTRRRALQGAAGLLAAFAGCAGAGSGSSSSTGTKSAGMFGDDNVSSDPDHYSFRAPEDTALVTRGTPGDEEAERWYRRDVVAERSTADALSFADVDGAAGARSFVDDTEFGSETLLVVPERVPECYRLDLCYVTWSAEEYHTYYARTLRDWTVDCSADASSRELFLIRVPATLDPEAVRSSGSATTGSTCRMFERRLERERNGSAGEDR